MSGKTVHRRKSLLPVLWQDVLFHQTEVFPVHVSCFQGLVKSYLYDYIFCLRPSLLSASRRGGQSWGLDPTASGSASGRTTAEAQG